MTLPRSDPAIASFEDEQTDVVTVFANITFYDQIAAAAAIHWHCQRTRTSRCSRNVEQKHLQYYYSWMWPPAGSTATDRASARPHRPGCMMIRVQRKLLFPLLHNMTQRVTWCWTLGCVCVYMFLGPDSFHPLCVYVCVCLSSARYSQPGMLSGNNCLGRGKARIFKSLKQRNFGALKYWFF